jgi:hypothetical protein
MFYFLFLLISTFDDVKITISIKDTFVFGGRRCRDRMVAGLITTNAFSANHPNDEMYRYIHYVIACDKVCQLLATGRGFSRVLLFPPSINLTSKIQLKVC